MESIMGRKNLGFLILVFYILISVNLNAGAWTQEKNGGFYKLGMRYISTTTVYDNDGNKVKIPQLTNLLLSFYAENGLNDHLTLIANASLFERIKINDFTSNGNIVSNGGSNSGIGDSELGFRYRLWHDDGSVFSTELIFGLPVGDTDNNLGLYTGDGEFNQILNILYGKSYYPVPLYLSAQVGFNNRTGGFSDEIRYSVEVGYSIVQNLLLALKIHGVQTLKNGDPIVFSGNYGFHSNDQKYLAFGPELNYSFTHSAGISFGFDSATNAANVPSALAFSFGIFFKH